MALANVPGVQARFYTDAAWTSQKKHFLPEVDFIDSQPRRETVATARGKPTMLQLTLQPAYALTIHKIQSLTIFITVQGCMEGVFAMGHIYVLASRVTDPVLFQLVGMPPEDLLDEVASAWREAGEDVDACFAKAAEVTNEWCYTPASSEQDACTNVRARFTAVAAVERRVPLRLKKLADILNPQVCSFYICNLPLCGNMWQPRPACAKAKVPSKCPAALLAAMLLHSASRGSDSPSVLPCTPSPSTWKCRQGYVGLPSPRMGL